MQLKVSVSFRTPTPALTLGGKGRWVHALLLQENGEAPKYYA